MANPAILWPVILLARAESADHTIGMLVGMIGRVIVAFIAGEDFGAAAEAEPAVAFAVVLAAAATGEFLAGGYT